MEALATKIGKIAVGAIVDAIRNGKNRAEAIDAAAAAVRREDVVSDELWNELQQYIDTTRDFEENGAD